ncbi:MAG: pilus assembly protein [Geminicoccaceae bacterium]|nr:pilus assembly protein [Geminicoccaceae bacterium]
MTPRATAERRRGWLGRFLDDFRAIVSVEMALVLPVLLVLFAGAADVGWLLIAQHKVGRAAGALADLTARAAELRESEVSDMFRAVQEITGPLDFARRGRAHVSTVANTLGTGARLRWQRASPGGLAVASRIGGTVGALADLGSGLTLALGEEVVVAEVQIEVPPIIGIVVTGPRTIYARAVLRPRYGSVTLLPG